MPVLSVKDLQRARSFYEKRLGLEASPIGQAPGHMLLDCPDGSHLVLHEVPDMRPSPNTAAGFTVPDLERAVAELRQHGVEFEEYDLPGLKTEQGIAEAEGIRSAWFKDPDGNVLCLDEFEANPVR